MSSVLFELVESFAASQRRFQSFTEILERGAAALPALQDGLKSSNPQVRRWCAICLDHVADSESLSHLIPLLRDRKSAVRLWAVHAIACDHCKSGVQCAEDVVPLLIERIEDDTSVRVRRMATIMLGTEFTDQRAAPVLRRLLDEEDDRKLRLHAEAGLRKLREAGIEI